MSVTSIELQVISKILTSDNAAEIDALCEFDGSYYSIFRPHIEFILHHKDTYGNVPDPFTFQTEFQDVTLVNVKESLTYLTEEIRRNKRHIMLIDTFNKLKDLGSGDVDDAWAYLEKQCEKVGALSSTQPLDLVKDAKKRSRQVIEYSQQARIPTGFPEIDKVMYGGLSTVEELLLLIARTNSGKAQPLNSKVLTPTGWVTMGSLKIGDDVVGENNDVGQVVKIFPQGEKDFYRVTFDDNTVVECCDDHLWKVLDCERRKRGRSNYGVHQILTLKEIRNSLSNKYSVDISDPIEFDVPFDESNELDGYLLGVILGDGGISKNYVTITNESEEIWGRIESILNKYGCERSGKHKDQIRGIVRGKNYVVDKLREYKLLGNKSVDKFIPKQYLTAPVHVRKALLAGLVDTDGYAMENRTIWEFDTASEQLCFDFAELARSLGIYVKVYDRKPSFYVTSDGVRHQGVGSRHTSCRSIFNPFWYSKKAQRYRLRTEVYNRSMPRRHCKKIRSVEYAGKTECQCILLNNRTHTYLTEGYTVTHNSWVASRIMESAQKHGFPGLYYSPEMQASFLGTRFDTWREHFPNSQLHQGDYTEAYYKYLTDLEDQETSAFVLEDKDVADGVVNVPVLKRFVKKHGIKIVIIDGLSYMEDSDGKRGDTDYVKYKNLCAALFKMSKECGCAVVVIMQANRATKDNKDDKGEVFPNIYNVEGSDHPARIATQVFAMRQIFDKHVLDIRLEKSRNANNQKPEFSYAWDINTGNLQYLPNGDDSVGSSVTPVISPDIDIPAVDVPTVGDTDLNADDDIEF